MKKNKLPKLIFKTLIIIILCISFLPKDLIIKNISNFSAVIFATPPLNAPSFYIRDGGVSATCSSWSDACDALPASLQRGAVYYIADGTYGGYIFDDALSGTDYVFVKKATASSHGSDAGWQNNFGDGVAQFTEPINLLTGFIWFDGVKGEGKSGHGFEVYISEQKLTSTSAFFIRGDNVSILHTKIYWPDGAANSEIFHQPLVNMGISVYKEFVTTNASIGDGYYPPIQNILLSYLYLKEIPGSFIGFQAEPSDVVVEHSVFDTMYSDSRPCCHGSAVTARGNSSNMTFRYNIFKDISESTGGITFYNNGSSSARHSNWNIYGNVFYLGGPGHGVITDNRQSPGVIVKENINVFNNTFVGHSQYGGVSFQNDTTNIRVFNNLFDNELYLTMFGITDRGYNYYSDVSSWLGFTPLTSANENPFVSDEPIVNAVAGDFSLNPQSLAVNAGVDICSVVNCADDPMLRYDAKGVLRGGDGGWDIGAYEFSTTLVPDILSPIILSFTLPPVSNSLLINIAALSASDNIGVTGYLVSESNILPAANDSRFSGTFSSYTFGSGGITLGVPISKTLYAFAKDSAGNVSSSLSASVLITLPVAPDTSAPVLSGGTPTGTLSSSTTSVTLSLSTNENAICKYNITAGHLYGDSSNIAFGTTGGTTHSQNLSGLMSGNSYSYYVRCIDGSGNINSSDYSISFSIDKVVVKKKSSGGGGAAKKPKTTIATSTIATTSSSIIPVKLCTNQNLTQIFKRNLKQGMIGTDVKLLQVFLNSKGFAVSINGFGSKGNETLYFGPATRLALSRYQVFNKITPAVGFFGQITRARVLSQNLCI